jgi:hypothetical protein
MGNPMHLQLPAILVYVGLGGADIYVAGLPLPNPSGNSGEIHLDSVGSGGSLIELRHKVNSLKDGKWLTIYNCMFVFQ